MRPVTHVRVRLPSARYGGRRVTSNSSRAKRDAGAAEQTAFCLAGSPLFHVSFHHTPPPRVESSPEYTNLAVSIARFRYASSPVTR